MGKTMIALVSEQRMQNIIPFYQKGISFDRLRLIRSTDADVANSRFARAWHDTCETLKDSFSVESAEPSVDAYGIAQTQEVAAKLPTEAPDQMVVNFTGGTKCMSIGAYLAAQDAKATALYVDTANEKLVWFYPDGRVQEEEFNLVHSLTVPIYLRANAKQIDRDRTRRQALPECAYLAIRELVNLWPRCRDTLEVFGRAVSQGQTPVGADEVDCEIATILARHNLAQQISGDWQATQQGRPFLTGKWLDAMVYVLLEDSGFFDDMQVDLCLQGIENELDVLVTRNGQMAIIECKSGDPGGQTTLNKLQAIRTGFGTFARTFFVTSREASQVDENFRNRAREYGVREIITEESLLHVADIVKAKMRGVA